MTLEKEGMFVAAYEAKFHVYPDMLQSWLKLKRIGSGYFLEVLI